MTKSWFVAGAVVLGALSATRAAHAGEQSLTQTLVDQTNNHPRSVTKSYWRSNPFCLWGWCPKFDLIAVSAMNVASSSVGLKHGALITFAGQAWGFGRTNTPNEVGTAVLMVDGRSRATSSFGATDSNNVQLAVQRAWVLLITEGVGRHTYQVCFTYGRNMDEADRSNNCTAFESFTVIP